MTATKFIILSVIAYVALFAIAYILFFNTKFTGGDAAGNGLEKGLTFIYGLGSLFLLAIILTLVNIYLFKGGIPVWVKLITFIPLLLPIVLFLFEFLALGKPTEPSTEEQAHRLTIEIKTSTALENATLLFRSSSGSSVSKLKSVREDLGIYFYEKSNALFNEEDRKFYVYSNEFKTPEYYLEIPYEPEVIPFTDWKVLQAMKSNGGDSVTLEFRYKITK